MNPREQNQKLGKLLLELNDDLEARENREVQVSLLEMIGYTIVGGLVLITILGILRALLWRMP
jgi:uncharacterized membrane protein YqhA